VEYHLSAKKDREIIHRARKRRTAGPTPRARKRRTAGPTPARKRRFRRPPPSPIPFLVRAALLPRCRPDTNPGQQICPRRENRRDRLSGPRFCPGPGLNRPARRGIVSLETGTTCFRHKRPVPESRNRGTPGQDAAAKVRAGDSAEGPVSVFGGKPSPVAGSPKGGARPAPLSAYAFFCTLAGGSLPRRRLQTAGTVLSYRNMISPPPVSTHHSERISP